MSAPLVTVAMATYNQAQYLPAALDGVFAQTLPREQFQVVVVNDGSTDATAEILRGYGDAIELISRPNRGLVASCNEALAAARGRYFGRVDSDDLVDPRWLEALAGALGAAPAAPCAVPDRIELRGDERIPKSSDPGNLYSLEACGTLFRTATLREAGGYRGFFWEEYDLYLRLRGHGRPVRVAQPLYLYRRHAASMTHDERARLEGWRELLAEWGRGALEEAGTNADLARVIAALDEELE